MQTDDAKLKQSQDFKSISTKDGWSFLAHIQHHLFDGELTKTALFYDGEAISYAALGRSVAKVMGALQQQNLKSGAVVAICLPKGAQHIYAVLACALMGVIWLPIDMDSPAARRAYLLSNSRVDLVISQTAVADYRSLLLGEVLLGRDVEPVVCHGQIDTQAAYYLYTSGSTGVPKCVVLNNLATANVLQQTIARWQLHQDDVLMAVTPFHHDMSVFDVLAAMALGASLVVPTPAQSKDAQAWAALVATYGVTVWVSVPAIVDMLCTVASTAQLQSLRLIAQGGDYIKPQLIRQLQQRLPQARLFSLGGPTETTIWSIWHEIGAMDGDVIPYGRPLAQNQYFILTESLQPCAVGEVGRMYMTGVNLSNGYLLNGQLHTQDFVPLAVAQDKLALRMSDLGYVREDGNIIFAGRAEGYLKVKGVRIAATEVEAALVKTGCFEDSVVVCCQHPVTQMDELVAVYTRQANQPPLDINALKGDLRVNLPLSHIPTQWLAVAEIPLTGNMKVDRRQVQQMAQACLYQEKMAKAAVDVQQQAMVDDILAIFRECQMQLSGYSGTLNIVCQTEILALGMRLKQLVQVADKISTQFDIQLNGMALVRCKTIQDVVNQVQIQMAN